STRSGGRCLLGSERSRIAWKRSWTSSDARLNAVSRIDWVSARRTIFARSASHFATVRTATPRYSAKPRTVSRNASPRACAAAPVHRSTGLNGNPRPRVAVVASPALVRYQRYRNFSAPPVQRSIVLKLIHGEYYCSRYYRASSLLGATSLLGRRGRQPGHRLVRGPLGFLMIAQSAGAFWLGSPRGHVIW